MAQAAPAFAHAEMDSAFALAGPPGAAGGAAAPQPPPPQIRKEFPETWLWQSITDDS